MKSAVCSLIVVAGLAASASAQLSGELLLNEIFPNPPSPEVDNTREFIELRAPASISSLAGYWLLQIDGDNNTAGDSIATGVVDLAIDLSTYTVGSNGLLLLRDSTLVLAPAPAAGTTVITLPDWSGCNNTLPSASIDLENGSSTWLIVRNFTGSVCQDLDTNNDGTLDITPWSSVVDAVGYIDGDDFDDGIGSRQYATQLGGIDVTDTSPGAPGFTPDLTLRLCSGWVTCDVFGVSPGPYVADPLEFRQSGAFTGTIDAFSVSTTPGNPNADSSCVSAPTCDSVDFNNDGVFPDDQDLADFIFVLGGGSCSACNDVDFNNDGVFPDDGDLAVFLFVLGGGAC